MKQMKMYFAFLKFKLKVDSASKKRRMRRPPVFDKVRKQPLRLTTLEPRIYKEEKYIAFMNEAMGNKENSNSLTANKFEKILGDSNLLQDEFSRAVCLYFYSVFLENLPEFHINA